MKNISKLLILLMIAVGLSASASADTIWNVAAWLAYDASLNFVSGSFTLDSSLNLVNWNVTVAGSNTQANNTYWPGDSIAVYPNTTHVDFYDAATNQYLNLYLALPLTNAGGTIPLLYGDGGQTHNATIACPGCATLISGFVTTATIPEPGSIALFGVGTLGLAGVLRRKLIR